MVEIMLILSIMCILILVATRYFRTAREYQRVNNVVTPINAVIAASENWVIGNQNYSGIEIAELIKNGYLPLGSENNPGYGKIQVNASDQNKQQLKIALTGLPVSACENLKRKFGTQYGANANSCGGNGEFNITIQPQKYESA